MLRECVIICRLERKRGNSSIHPAPVFFASSFMPRTHAFLSPPGFPPVRLLSFDNLGLIKVLESSGESVHPQVVARWGEPNPQRSILCASFSSEFLAVARRNKTVEIVDPSSGFVRKEIHISSDSSENADHSAQLVDVHLLSTESSRSLLTCADSGNATLRAVSLDQDDPAIITWKVCKTGSILCMKVDRSDKYAAFAGDGVEPSVWDVHHQKQVWEAKAPRRDSMGLMSHPFVTSSTFLGDDHRKLIVGTGHHQIRLYDISAQRRPILSFDFLEAPIKAVEADCDGHCVFAGTGNGDLASFDTRTGKLLGVFKGKCSGSIRSIAKHPSLPIFATCGLDRYLRIFHTTTRQLLSRVFLKQQLVAVVFDINYPKQPESTNIAKEDSQRSEVTSDDRSDVNGDEDIPQKSSEQITRKKKTKRKSLIEGSLKKRRKNEDEMGKNAKPRRKNELVKKPEKDSKVEL